MSKSKLEMFVRLEARRIIKEDRLKGLEYSVKQKTTNAKKVLDRVTLDLTKQTGKVAAKTAEETGKLLHEFSELDSQVKNLEVKRDSVKGDVRQHFDSLFNCDDALMTRAIQIGNIGATLAKKTTQTTVHVDIDNLIHDLTMLVPDLTSKIMELAEKYTTVTTVEKDPALRVKDTSVKTEQFFHDAAYGFPQTKNILLKIKTLALNFYTHIKSWLKGFDHKLTEIEQKLSKI